MLINIPRTARVGSGRRTVVGILALAATFVLGLGVATYVRLESLSKPAGLIQVVYQHIIGEPQALVAVVPVKRTLINVTLKDFGVSLKEPVGEIMHITLCPVAGTHGLHIVTKGERGPITILYLPTKSLDERQVFSYGRFVGYIEPTVVGLVAVIGEKGETRLEEAHSAIQGALIWL